MSDIIDFSSREVRNARGSTHHRAPLEIESYESDTIRFDFLDASSTLKNTLREFQSHYASDWTNQELATLYRTQKLLEMAELSVSTDRGLSDEGEPWFVFLNAFDDVVVHICRIDSEYVLDSLAQERLIRAASLDGLVEKFARQTNKTIEEHEDARSAVLHLSRRQGSKIRVHPGAALAALIWSIFIVTDNNLKQGRGQDHPIVQGAEYVDDMIDDPNHDQVDAKTSHSSLDDLTMQDQSIRLERVSAESNRIENQFLNGALPMSVLGIGLGSMNSGLEGWRSGVDQALTDAETRQEQAAPNSENAGAAETSETGSIVAETTDVGSEETVGTEAIKIQAKQEALEDGTLFESLVKTVNTLLDNSVIETNLKISLDHELAGGLPIPTEFAQAPYPDEAVSNDDAQAGFDHQIDTAPAAFETEIAFSTLGDVLDSFDGSEIVFLSNAHGVSAWIDANTSLFGPNLSSISDMWLVSGTENQDLTGDAYPSQGDSPDILTGDFDPFDAQARAFLDFLFAGDSTMKLVSYETEVLIIDDTAMTQDDVVLYSKSWTLSDGAIISTIGLKSDFEAFDLIA